MTPKGGPASRPPQGGGVLGFGCGFVVALIVAFAVIFPLTGLALAGDAIFALIVGLLVARHGDQFFEKFLGIVRWIFPRW